MVAEAVSFSKWKCYPSTLKTNLKSSLAVILFAPKLSNSILK